MRDRAGRAAVAATGQAVGRHERSPRQVSRATRDGGAQITLVGPDRGTPATGRPPAAAARRTRAAQAHGTQHGTQAVRAAEAHGTQAMRPARAYRTQAVRVPQAPGTQAHGTQAHGTQAMRAAQAQVPGSRAGRAAQVRGTRSSRHAARGRWGSWAGRVERAAGQTRLWWSEGAERVAARARERWAEHAPGSQRAGGRAPAAERFGAAGHLDPARRTRRAAGSPRHLAAAAGRASRREDMVTGWCSLLLVLGLYLDGWSDANRVGGGPVLTLWHGVLYLGFTATAGWILTRNQRRGAWSLRAVPAGYRLALVGVGLAMVAVAGDAVWHTLFGVDHGLARLVSPFHLVLFTGACLLVSSALRAAWSGPTPARVPGLRVFWPVLVSTTLVVAMTAFFFQYVSPVVALGRPGLAGSPLADTVRVYELLGLLAHNLLFIGPVLLLLLRWQTPLGTFTVMAGSVGLLLATQADPGLVGLVGAAVLGGAAADVAVRWLRPSPQRRWAARSVAVIAPAVYWTSHFVLLKAGYGVGREPELWLGSVLWASLSGFTLALLMWPPAVPLTAWNRVRSRPPAGATPTAMPARMVGR